MTKKDFDKVLLEAIDEALGLLGSSARQSTYFYLEHKFKIARKDIPRETYDYVFYIFSAAVICENPRLFGFDITCPSQGPEKAPAAGG